MQKRINESQLGGRHATTCISMAIVLGISFDCLCKPYALKTVAIYMWLVNICYCHTVLQVVLLAWAHINCMDATYKVKYNVM